MKITGFTLIELMVAISIIAIAFGVIITSSSGIQKSSRDTQRQANLRVIQSAMQQYYADQNFYPSSINLSTATTFKSSDGNPSPPSSTKTYLNEVPKDPNSPTTPYTYDALPADCDNDQVKCVQFCLYANLELALAIDSTQCSNLSGYDFEITQP